MDETATRVITNDGKLNIENNGSRNSAIRILVTNGDVYAIYNNGQLQVSRTEIIGHSANGNGLGIYNTHE